MKWSVVVLMVSCTLAVNAQAVSQKTHEETVVRTAYAKLAYAVQLHDIYAFTQDASTGLNERLRKNELRFTLTDVRTGNLADIANEKYSDLVTEPDGRDVIDATVNTIEYADNDKKTKRTMATVEARWAHGQTVTEDWNVPLSKLLPLIESQNRAAFYRYVAATVTVSYLGRHETYKALWLFGQDFDSKPYFVAGDTIVEINGGSLHHTASHAIYPALETQLADKQEVRDWFAAHVVASCGTERDSCCDFQTLQCGISSANMQQSLAEREANR